MFFDPLYLIFMLPGLALALWAQAKTRGAYQKYSEYRNMQGMTGAQVARSILDMNGLGNVTIEETPEELGDHYDPTTKILRLSPGVGRQPTIAAMGIAAHEVGHAIQDAHGFAPMRARAGLVPVAQFGSQIGYFALIGGLMLQITGLAAIGLILFSFGAVFALVTLPVEFDASRRAMAALQTGGFVSQEEYRGAKTVLDAAAWTYVAGFVSTILMVLYFALQVAGLSRRDD
ncbi:MAG: zinc metallopeptidase [Chloroflexota bacterium]|nr:MAG: zinc metallopeptidase [Chloroflexota bacterium]